MGKKLITLDRMGVVDGIDIRMTKLLSYFLAADENQSSVYKVQSFKYLVANHGEDPTIMADKVREAIETMMTPYFDTIEVSTESVIREDGVYSISLGINVVDDGMTGSLARMLETIDSPSTPSDYSNLRQWT